MAEVLPSEKREAANAAYLNRKSIQEELIERMRNATISIDQAEFWFSRWKRAKNLEDRLEEEARAEVA